MRPERFLITALRPSLGVSPAFLPSPTHGARSRADENSESAGKSLRALITTLIIKRVLSVTSLNLSHALSVDFFRRYACSPKGHALAEATLPLPGLWAPTDGIPINLEGLGEVG